MPNMGSGMIVSHVGAVVISAILLGIASFKDIAARTIPNFVSLSIAAIGFAFNLIVGNKLNALAASVAVFSAGALIWRFGWLGGGDVKLLAACALLVPPSQVLQLVLFTAVAGGGLACLYIVLSCIARTSGRPVGCERPQSLLGRIGRVECWRIRRRAGLPYACAIAIGTLLTLSIR
jgi:prepilin peptidase CpaA